MITYIKDNTEYKLDKDQSEALKKDIISRHQSYQEDLTIHIGYWEEIKKHIFGVLEQFKGVDEKGKVKDFTMTKIYELDRTYQAQLKNKCASSVESMFGVEGNTLTDQDNSATMKAFIEDKLEKMDYLGEYDELVKNYVRKGASYTFTEWKEDYREVKRIVTNPITGIKERISQVVPIYEGSKAISLDPHSIVYDKNKMKDWDSCPKIIRNWVSVEDVLSRKDYKISKETQETLKTIGKNNQEGSELSEDDKILLDEATNADMIEVLEFWGDLRLPDGDFLKNWHVVVIGRLEVAKFCKNPFLINPITRCSFEDHPETGREISPLLVAIVNNIMKSDVFRKILTGMAYANNPCHITNGDIGLPEYTEAAPGLHIKTSLKSDGLNQGSPILYTIDGGNLSTNFEVLSLFDVEMEQSTGINKYLTGNIGGSKVDFATEASGIMGGGEVRVQKDVENINKNLTKVTIEKIAQLEANMASDSVEIKTRESGKVKFETVTPEIIQGNYEFKIADTKQQSLNRDKAKLTTEILEKGINVPDFNGQEAFKYALENLVDIKDTSRFFVEDELQKALNAIPKEQQEQAKQMLLETLKTGQQAKQVDTPDEAVKEIAAKAIIRDTSRPDSLKVYDMQALRLQDTLEFQAFVSKKMQEV